MGNDKSISVSIPVNLTVAVSLITTAIVMFKFINEPFIVTGKQIGRAHV